MGNLIGIDVSTYQKGKVDWNQVKAAGASFAMIRAGYGSDIRQKDNAFDAHMKGALAVGLDVGAYWFSYALNTADAVKEAETFMAILEPYKGKIAFPVCFDFEYDSVEYAKKKGIIHTPAQITDMAIAFLKRMEECGWYAMNYLNLDYWINKFQMSRLTAWDIWYSRPGRKEPDRECGIWQDQFGGTGGHFPGVAGNVPGTCDTNVSFKNYPEIIKAAGLNGFHSCAEVPKPPAIPNPEPEPKPVPAPPTRSYTVIKGDCLWNIARDLLGDGSRFTEIMKINGLDSEMISVGQVLKIPSNDATPAPAEKTYTVKRGDCLCNIARDFLGEGARYNEIKTLNDLSDDTIVPGQVLKIPT